MERDCWGRPAALEITKRKIIKSTFLRSLSSDIEGGGRPGPPHTAHRLAHCSRSSSSALALLPRVFGVPFGTPRWFRASIQTPPSGQSGPRCAVWWCPRGETHLPAALTPQTRTRPRGAPAASGGRDRWMGGRGARVAIRKQRKPACTESKAKDRGSGAAPSRVRGARRSLGRTGRPGRRGFGPGFEAPVPEPPRRRRRQRGGSWGAENCPVSSLASVLGPMRSETAKDRQGLPRVQVLTQRPDTQEPGHPRPGGRYRSSPDPEGPRWARALGHCPLLGPVLLCWRESHGLARGAESEGVSPPRLGTRRKSRRR